MTAVAAVVAAAAAALAFGVSAILEQRSVHQVPERSVLAPRLLWDLARQRLWWAALAATLAGVAFQVLALHLGPLALVQPVLVCGLLFAVLISAAVRHRRPDRVMLAGAACCTAGLAGFLAAARPGAGRQTVSLPAAIPLAAVLAVVLAACLAMARLGPHRLRPIALAVACGTVYGVTAFVFKLVPPSLGQGFSQPLRVWPLGALVIVAPLGYLLNQNVFQASALLAPVLAVITVADPLVSVGIAHLWLGEPIAAGAFNVTVEAASLLVMAAGITALAHRAPLVAASQPHRSVYGLTESRQCG
jgi:drug/metabolite transporter (DMT)-like permease